MKSVIIDYVLLVKVIIKNIFKIKYFFNEKYTLVTASDSKHFIYLENLVENYKKLMKHFTKIVIYDLGLEPSEVKKLLKYDFIEFRKFPFEDYPAHFKKRIEEHSYKIGGFSWKPAIIKILTKEESLNNIIWFDSANLFNRRILFFKLLIFEFGFLSFHSTGCVKDWTHPYVLKELNLEHRNEILNSNNLMGGVVGFNPKSDLALKLLEEWYELALNENYIFPKESNASNHRHDQSLLTICYWLNFQQRLPVNTNIFGIKIQNWPNKILFFFDEKIGLKKELLKKYYFQSTTTNSRCKIIILFNAESLKKIPLKLILTKKILLFIYDDRDIEILNTYFIKKRFVDIYINENLQTKMDTIKGKVNFGFHEINQIIENQYKLLFNGR